MHHIRLRSIREREITNFVQPLDQALDLCFVRSWDQVRIYIAEVERDVHTVWNSTFTMYIEHRNLFVGS